MMLNKKQARALRMASYGGNMYEGERWDSSPAQFRKLENKGFVSEFQPHNYMHKVRAVITLKGEKALKEWSEENVLQN